MNMMRSSLAALFGGALLFTGAAVAPAQSVVTEPVGFTTLSVASRPSSAQRSITYLSLNMFRPTAFRGVVTSAAGTVLTFPANSFTANQFTPSASPNGTGQVNAHFVEVTNGSGAGVIADIVSNTTNQITLSEDITAFISGGSTTFRVRPHWTIGTAIPTAGFNPGASPAIGDTLSVISGDFGTITNYFVHTSGQWRLGGANASDVILRPDVGLLFERKPVSGTGVSFTLTGEVKLGSTEIAVYGGATTKTSPIPNVYPLASRMMRNTATPGTNDLNLFTNNAATGLVAGANPATADNLLVIAPGGGTTTTYFLHTSGEVRVGGANRSTDTIPEGAAVLIVRKAGRASFAWLAPAPAMNL